MTPIINNKQASIVAIRQILSMKPSLFIPGLSGAFPRR
jgi:hypothetical protein